MTNGGAERLNQHEQWLAEIREVLSRTAQQQAENTVAIAELRSSLAETRQIADSNARAVQAWESRITEAEAASTAMTADTNRDLREAIADTVAMIADLAEQQGETDQRFEVFLQDARADRQRADERHQEWGQRFDAQLAAMREDRDANATEHRAFSETIRVLLAEIARIWQRLAG